MWNFLTRCTKKHLRIPRFFSRNRTQKTLNQEVSGMRVGTVAMEFDTNDDAASGMDSVGSSVPDTPTVNSNPGRSKYGRTYRRTMHYGPKADCTISYSTGQLLPMS
jgi:hypothetical protein